MREEGALGDGGHWSSRSMRSAIANPFAATLGSIETWIKLHPHQQNGEHNPSERKAQRNES
jgi:hypothetical protein